MLYIIANRFFLTSFLLDRLDESPDTVKIFHPISPKGVKYSLIKFYESVFLKSQKKSKFFPSDYIVALQKIKPTDSVLIFGIENIKELIVLKRFISSNNISIFTWNPVIDYKQSKFFRKIHIESLKKLGAEVYTFDPEDARKYTLKLINQVYRDVTKLIDSLIPVTTDVYFVGQDKGRLPILKMWIELLKSKELTTDFHIFKEKKANYQKNELALISDKYITYEENIKKIQASRCLFELLQENQSGQTIRSLEAAFFQKKLITNNSNIRQTSLYDPDRVFILGEDDSDKIGEFIRRPFKKIPESVLEKYDFKEWVVQFKVHKFS